jgi:radical SAM superfamily enzyme YgiQ (UPF0313 family)
MQKILKKMRILLLRPFIEEFCGIYPPLSLMYLSSYLKSLNKDVLLMDRVDIKSAFSFAHPDSRQVQKMVEDIQDYHPDLIGMTLFSRELKEMQLVCKFLKKEFPFATIVLGGPHPTAMPRETLEQIQDCDFVVRGESELVLNELIDCLLKKGELNTVKGIGYRWEENREIYVTPEALIIENLDVLPFPDRESVIDFYRRGIYSSLLFGSPIDNIMTSRGCVYNCDFCSKVCVKYRSRSPQDVIKEIDWVVRNIQPETIQIMDDSFTLQRDRCVKILDLMDEKKYKCKFRVRSRVDAVDDALLKKMKKSGVDTVVYGFESGSQKMLDKFNKRTKVEQNIRACALTIKNRLNCFGDFMLFYPGETTNTLKETQDFIQKAKPTLVWLHLLTPLPKTKVYEDAKKNGTLNGSWDRLDFQPWVKVEGFDSLKTMEQVTKKMRIKILLNPFRLLWVLRAYGVAVVTNPLASFRVLLGIIFGKAKY